MNRLHDGQQSWGLLLTELAPSTKKHRLDIHLQQNFPSGFRMVDFQHTAQSAVTEEKRKNRKVKSLPWVWDCLKCLCYDALGETFWVQGWTVCCQSPPCQSSWHLSYKHHQDKRYRCRFDHYTHKGVKSRKWQCELKRQRTTASTWLCASLVSAQQNSSCCEWNALQSNA